MKKRRSRRAGATETFSVSVDVDTKRALRRLADTRYGGNLSALVTDFAEEARRRFAASQYLERHGVAETTPAELREIETGIEREVRAYRARRGRKVA
jgi:hypothetical protein